MIVYAVINGYIDDVPVEKIREWEHGFHEFMRTQHPQVGEAIKTKKAIGKDDEPALVSAINAYKETWAAQHSSAQAK